LPDVMPATDIRPSFVRYIENSLVSLSAYQNSNIIMAHIHVINLCLNAVIFLNYSQSELGVSKTTFNDRG